MRDYDGQTVKNPKLEIYKVEKGFNKIFAFVPQKIVEVSTNDGGIYRFNLLPDTYTIESEQAGFKKLVIKNFKLINSTYGKIIYDLILELGEPSTPYARIFKDFNSIEYPKIEVSD